VRLSLVPTILVLGALACGETRATRTGREGTFPCADARQLPAAATTRRSIAEAILRTESVDLYLDPRRPAVVVPPRFRGDHGLVLRIGRDLPTPIPDLYIDDDGISATLSFDGQPFHCEVPWFAVVAIVSTQKNGAVWADATPAELRCEDSTHARPIRVPADK
jgi:hypothetical protein